MKTDKTLLELAAKAAGWKIAEWMLFNGIEVALFDDGMTYWQPLIPNSATDCDGDAFRLAVKLQLFGHLVMLSGYSTAAIEISKADDPYAATRRCITRDAAAIGEKM